MNANRIKLLLVADEDDFRRSCAKWMQQKGWDVHKTACFAGAWDKLENIQFDVAVLDLSMSGLELLKRIRVAEIDVEVVMLTSENTGASALAAMKLGACDLLSKPCSLSKLENHILLAHQRGQLRKENQQLRAIISRSRGKSDLIWSPSVLNDVTWN